LDPTFSTSAGDTNSRLIYSQDYEDGSHCDANKKPRRTQVDFYCDVFATEKGDLVKILDISEPDWCSYLFKVSTKYMCTGVA
jgi:hypothetical protein